MVLGNTMDSPMAKDDPQRALRLLHLLPAVRERANIIYTAAKNQRLQFFEFDASNMSRVTDYVLETIKETYGPDQYDQIKTHGRWNHFEYDGIARIDEIMETWVNDNVPKVEQARRIIDLIWVSVLLDAGVPSNWKYVDLKGITHTRSEGLAIASLEMYLSGVFSMGNSNKYEINYNSLNMLTTEHVEKGLQVTPANYISGVEYRVLILQRFGASMSEHSLIFGESSRPGNIVDVNDANLPPNVRSVDWLWSVLQKALIPIWPSTRCNINGIALGDSWPLSTLAHEQHSTSESDSIQPFHKLTQWLAYSLMLPFEKILGISWQDTELLTGLPEYRNGGLLIDLGVLSLKSDSLRKGLERTKKSGSTSELPTFDVADEVVVEWRAMTVALLDELRRMLHIRHREFFEPDEAGNVKSFKITMGQLLEAGSWKAGRKVAKEHRPETGSGPFIIISDGTVF